MDPSDAARRLVREQYAAVRQALTLLDEQVLARYWDEGAPVRTGFGRFLGSLDEAAGRLLRDEDISGQGQDPQRTDSGTSPAEPGAAAEPESTATTAAEPESAAPAAAGPESTATTAAEPESAAPAAADPESAAPAEPGAAAEPEGAAATPGAEPGMVEVIFTLPAEVEAESVALAGEFNDWATDEIMLERGGDGAWRATVALAPGRSYRYRYLLDGERWENAWHADRYEPNSFGSVDSVVVVD